MSFHFFIYYTKYHHLPLSYVCPQKPIRVIFNDNVQSLYFNIVHYKRITLSELSTVCSVCSVSSEKKNVEYTMHYMRSSGTLILRIYHQYKYWCRYCNLTSSQVNEPKALKVVNPKVVIWFSRALTWRKTTYRELTTWYSPHMFYYIQTTSWCYNFNVLFCRRQQNNCR